MKNILLTLTLLFCSSLVLAQNNNAIYEEEILKGRQVKLNEAEKRAIEIAKVWRKNENSQMPIVGENGNVTYLFGKAQPVMICAPLEVCVIRLEIGEAITTMQSGDNVRWKITPAIVGGNGIQRTEVIVKPLESGLVSSLYIGTNKRSYNIKLKSSRYDFISFMDFIYPSDFTAEIASYQAKLNQANQHNSIDVINPNNRNGEVETKQKHVDELDFDYSIKGDTLFKPERVYNDGIRTIIVMDDSIKNTDLPSLLVLDERNKKNIVNYRVRNNRFIVDQVFNKAVLISGVGSKQLKVTITRN